MILCCPVKPGFALNAMHLNTFLLIYTKQIHTHAYSSLMSCCTLYLTTHLYAFIYTIFFRVTCILLSKKLLD